MYNNEYGYPYVIYICHKKDGRHSFANGVTQSTLGLAQTSDCNTALSFWLGAQADE